MTAKRNILFVIFFGSLIGLNESLLGSFNFPYRSVILSMISLTLLSFARNKIPKVGTSLLIVLIAIIFKINSIGFYKCSTNVLLCGPTALLLLGISYEIFATLIIKPKQNQFIAFALCCLLTSITAFSAFGIMNTYILKTWEVSRFIEYISLKSLLAGTGSTLLTIISLLVSDSLAKQTIIKPNALATNLILGFIIIISWIYSFL